MTKSEVVAYLDTLERDLLGLSKQVKELKLIVFEGLDGSDDDVLD
jgi:hypothetical protein